MNNASPTLALEHFPLRDSELTIRPHSANIAPHIFALIDANRQHLRQWLAWVDGTDSLAVVEEFIAHCLRSFDNSTEMHGGIYIDDTLVGCIGINDICPTSRTCYFGYWIATAHQGKGYVTRACQLLMTYCFATLELIAIDIRAAHGNQRSWAIPLRLGFVHQPQVRMTETVNGITHPMKVYRLTRKQWEDSR